MQTGARLQNIKNIAIYCYAEHLRFRFEEFFTDEALFKCPLSILERCPCYRQYSYSKITEKWQGPTPGVHPREVSVL